MLSPLGQLLKALPGEDTGFTRPRRRSLQAAAITRSTSNPSSSPTGCSSSFKCSLSSIRAASSSPGTSICVERRPCLRAFGGQRPSPEASWARCSSGRYAGWLGSAFRSSRFHLPEEFAGIRADCSRVRQILHDAVRDLSAVGVPRAKGTCSGSPFVGALAPREPRSYNAGDPRDRTREGEADRR